MIPNNRPIVCDHPVKMTHKQTEHEKAVENVMRNFIQVIRCRDCRYLRASRSINDVTITECLYAMPVWTEPNGYCYHAKRKNDDQNT